jgi:hypothetical protein
MFVIGLVVAAAGHGWADSALPLLGKFDAQLIETVYPPSNSESLGELAKLVFRLRSIDPAFLSDKVSAQANRLGDAAHIDGAITSIKALKVPDRLVEFLEISRLNVIDVTTTDGSESEPTSRIITADLPPEAKVGDRIRGSCVLIESPSGTSPGVFAASRVSWFPQSPLGDGWKLLSLAGVDVSHLSDLATRSRLPLSARDGDAFYGMLAAARQIGKQRGTPRPQSVTAIMLLGGTRRGSASAEPPSEIVTVRGGDWIEMRLQTVQVTRVAVTEPKRQEQLGSDHYFQIDAVGDLGNVDVEIERPEGEEGPPARFENRYPVSLVTTELPKFLSERIRSQESGEATVAEIGVAINVDAFFFRLWSYSTDYMDQFGGGNQIGPLLIAARISQRGEIDDPAGVGRIGWLAAIAVLAAMVAIAIWNFVLGQRDRRVKEKRVRSEAEQIQLPRDAAL